MKNLNILIAEDNPDDADLLVNQLEEMGYSVQSNRVDTESAFITELHTKPDIIFSDYSMPQFSGQRALELLRHSGYDIPLILISGTVGEEIAVESMRYGATDYLLKGQTLRLGNSVARALKEKQLRSESIRSLEKLKESEERFREVVENINEVFWITNPEKTKVIYISPAFEKIWQRSCESLYADASLWLASVHPDDRDLTRRQARTAQVSGRYNEIYRIIRPDGSFRWVHDKAFPIKDSSGNVYRIVGIAEDITTQRQLEEQLRHSQKMEAIGQLAGGVAHDFNNILQAMMMQVEVMLIRELDDETKEHLNGLKNSAERAVEITRQLLTFSRRQMIQLKRIDLNGAIPALTKLLQRLIGSNIQIQMSLYPAPMMIRADPAMLDQVLMNLVVNARDSMPQGGTLKIETSFEEIGEFETDISPQIKKGRYIRLAVSDNGHGIPEDLIPRIFEPFFTTKEAGKGTGLGLATVFGIVQQHHGGIRVHSKLGQGSIFEIFLPELSDEKADNEENNLTLNLPQGTENVLIVEDDDSIRKMCKSLLEQSGYQVLEANTIKTAQDLFQKFQQSIQLLLTDINIPGPIHGMELARQFSQEKPDLEILFTTGNNSGSADPDIPADQCITKPYTAQELLQKVRFVLDRRLGKPSSNLNNSAET